MTIDLQNPGALKQLSNKIKQDIDQFCSDHWDEGPRSHLGASEIGHECNRYLWLKFRWTFYKKHDGRQQRLFQRGHFEEPRFKMYLEGIGFKVTEFDEEALAKGETDKGKMQIRISACKGHFGGSIDGIAEHSEYGRFLTEYKTSGTGKKFIDLTVKGVKLEKYVHFCQQSIYGYKLNLQHAIYLCVNKNDDDLYPEVIELDHKLGADLENKAEMIIFSETSPAAVSMSPSYFKCGYCDAKGACYGSEQSLINCRSCKLCHPIEDAQWYCEKWNAIVPTKEAIFAACPEWESLI